MTPTVLYVDDDEANRLLMQAVFERVGGVRLVCADSGRAAMALAARMESKLRLLLLDIHLPDCHGGALLRRLRGLDACAGIPAIAVTSENLALDDSGFDALWPKPLKPAQVLRDIERILGSVC